MLLIIKNLLHFLIYRFCVCSDVMFSELLITHEEQLTCLFLTFITCYVDLLMSQLLVVVKTFIELMRFIELKKFRKKEKNERLFFNASKYLINLF